MPVVERAELLEAFGALERGLRQLGEAIEEGRREAVDAEVREPGDLAGDPGEGDPAPREVQARPR